MLGLLASIRNWALVVLIVSTSGLYMLSAAQHRTILRLQGNIKTLEASVALTKIAAKKQGKIDAMQKEYTRKTKEAPDAKNTNIDGNYSMDFDWLF